MQGVRVERREVRCVVCGVAHVGVRVVWWNVHGMERYQELLVDCVNKGHGDTGTRGRRQR